MVTHTRVSSTYSKGATTFIDAESERVNFLIFFFLYHKVGSKLLTSNVLLVSRRLRVGSSDESFDACKKLKEQTVTLVRRLILETVCLKGGLHLNFKEILRGLKKG